MKKGLEKFLSIALFTLGGILIILLLLAVFGTIDAPTLTNQVVRSMILGLSFAFIGCAIVMAVISFKDTDVLKSIVMSSDRASTTRVSLSVIRKIVSKNAEHIDGLKVSGIALALDENNSIRMKLTVKISQNDVDLVVDKFRCLLFDAFYEVLGVEFSSIDFKVKALSPKYAPDMNKIDRAALEIKEKREKLMLQKLKMDEEEAHFEELRKETAEKRKKEEARLKREREEARRRERQAQVDATARIEDIADGAEEAPVSFSSDNFEMPAAIAGTERPLATGEETEHPSEKQVAEDDVVPVKATDEKTLAEQDTLKEETAATEICEEVENATVLLEEEEKSGGEEDDANTAPAENSMLEPEDNIENQEMPQDGQNTK